MRNVITDEPENLDATYKLGMEHHDKGNIKAAEELLSLAAKGYEDTYGTLDSKTLDALEYLGITYRKLGKLKDALNDAKAAIDLQPDHWKVRIYTFGETESSRAVA